MNEGENVTIEIKRDGNANIESSVFYKTIELSASNNDYIESDGILIFSAFEKYKNLTIKIKNDEEIEDDEIFFVKLYNATRFLPRNWTRTVRVIILANDNGSGIFEFAQKNIALKEEAPGKINVIRSFSFFGEVFITWEIQLASLKENIFENITGLIHFRNTQKISPLWLFPIDDKVPELGISFNISLTSVLRYGANKGKLIFAGGSIGPERIALIHMEPSDHPNGLFSVCGTILISEDNETDSQKNLTIFRKLGLFGSPTILWEIFDPNIFPKSSIDSMIDLFLILKKENCSQTISESNINSLTEIIYLDGVCALKSKTLLAEKLKHQKNHRDFTLSFRIKVLQGGNFFEKAIKADKVFILGIFLNETICFQYKNESITLKFQKKFKRNEWINLVIIIRSHEVLLFHGGKLSTKRILPSQFEDDDGLIRIGEGTFRGTDFLIQRTYIYDFLRIFTGL